MINIKEETRIKFSAHEVEETLRTERKMEGVDNMKSAKVKMEEVREENERLKLTLYQMMKDYQSLKKQFNGKIKDEDVQFKIPTDLAPMSDDDDESKLVSLSLGRFSSSGDSMREKKPKLGLGLDWKSSKSTQVLLKPGNRFDESKEEGKNDVVSSRRISPKTSRSTGDDEDDILQQYPALKKPRVSVRAVCNTQTMHDGCQWRKYGQKISKGNPCPRAYYRCTVSSLCPVRKQVQRCMNDMRVLITTYEGTHNHALPPSAASMVSATTAAAAMLNCGSSTSPPHVHGVSTTNRFGFNTPNSSYNPITISSSSQSHPTVVLDLTTPNHTNKFSSALFPPPTSLNFSSPNPNNTLQSAGSESIFPSMNIASSPFSRPTSFYKTMNDQKIDTAAKEIITRDPTFQSALAAAITSFVGRNSGLNFNLNFSQQSTSSNGSIGCATSFLNKFPQSVLSQQTVDFAPLSSSKSQAIPVADEDLKEIKLL
ncbi:hypothetical protein ACS0TY_009945 [Phlomoides rotata]